MVFAFSSVTIVFFFLILPPMFLFVFDPEDFLHAALVGI